MHSLACQCCAAARWTTALHRLPSLADVASPQALSFPALLPAVKRETAKFVKDVLEHSPKAVVTKCAPLLPACAKLAGAGESDVREAGQEALVAFAVRSGSMSVLDKVDRGRGWEDGQADLGRGASCKPG